MMTQATETFARTVLSHPHCSVSSVFETPPAIATMKEQTKISLICDDKTEKKLQLKDCVVPSPLQRVERFRDAAGDRDNAGAHKDEPAMENRLKDSRIHPPGRV